MHGAGSVIKVAGRGHHGRGGGASGDLLVLCSVEQSRPGMRRQGADIHSEVSVPVWAALLGTKISWSALGLPSADGSAALDIPAGAAPLSCHICTHD